MKVLKIAVVPLDKALPSIEPIGGKVLLPINLVDPSDLSPTPTGITEQYLIVPEAGEAWDDIVTKRGELERTSAGANGVIVDWDGVYAQFAADYAQLIES